METSFHELNLNSIEKAVRLPEITHQKELPQQIEELTVLV